jgi:hypothetical protein
MVSTAVVNIAKAAAIILRKTHPPRPAADAGPAG